MTPSLRDLSLPPGVRLCVGALKASGGRAFLVGGAVRDALRIPGENVKDWDIEVFGLDETRTLQALRSVARAEKAGDSFPVFKVAHLEGVDGEVDVALPRRDSKKGPGHRGIEAVADPTLEPREAARRRDFTINAMMLDLETGELLDPFGGAHDLAAQALRAVDARTFGEDPLRALRAAQFAARFDFSVDADTAALCRAMPLGELPAERIWGEIEKALLTAPRPSRAFALLADWGQLKTIAPELTPLATTPQDPEWHPEGDVWTHTLLVIDEARRLIDDAELGRPRKLAVMLGALCHDLGKPSTTSFEDGRIRSRGHEEAGVAPTLALLDRWNIHTRDGYPLRDQVVALVRDHLKPGMLYASRGEVSDGAIRRLARRVEPDLLYRVSRADCLGRTGNFPPIAMEWFAAKVRDLAIERGGPKPFLRGQDLLDVGLKPGPEIGRVLATLYERQLDGEIPDRESALREARRFAATQA